MSRTTIERLRNLELFAGCGRRELERIDQLTVTLQIPAGRRLCAEGARGEEFFVLLDGVANLHSSSGGASLLGAGAWFGEGDAARRRAPPGDDRDGQRHDAARVRPARVPCPLVGFPEGACPPRRASANWSSPATPFTWGMPS